MIFFAQGILVEMASWTVMFHLELLGYTIPQIQILDGLVNCGWYFRDRFHPRYTVPVQAFGVLFWVALIFNQIPVLFMFLSETCVALHQSAVERDGLNDVNLRELYVGKTVGALLGGVVNRHLGKEFVYGAQALVFWLLLISQGCLFPLPPPTPSVKGEEVMPRPFLIFILLLAASPDPGMSLFFYFSDKLRFTTIQFGFLDALGTAALLLGTYYHAMPHLQRWFMAVSALYWFAVFLVLSRWILGWDLFILAIPMSLVGFFASGLSTRYVIQAGKRVSHYATLVQGGRAIGAALSIFLALAFEIDHDAYRNLQWLVLICACSSALVGGFGASTEPAENTNDDQNMERDCPEPV